MILGLVGLVDTCMRHYECAHAHIVICVIALYIVSYMLRVLCVCYVCVMCVLCVCYVCIRE